MGRPSKAKLLEILRLQQNSCANCSTPLEERLDRRISKIFPYSKSTIEHVQMGKETNPLPPTNKSLSENSISELTLTEAVRTVFEAALKINKVTVSSSETTLFMCEQCASSLSNLYWIYKKFLDMSRQESYIRAAIKNCLLWQENYQDHIEKVDEKANESLAVNISETSLTSNANLDEIASSKRILLRKESTSRKISTKYYSEFEIEELSNEGSIDNNLHVPEPDDVSQNTISGTNIKCSGSKDTTERHKNTIDHNKSKRRKQSVPQRRKTTFKHLESTTKINKKKTLRRKIQGHSKDLIVSKTSSLKKSRKRLPKKKNTVSVTQKASSFKKILSISKESEKILCTICGKKCQSPALLKLHIAKCKKKVKYSICRYCGKKFSLKLLRDRHENIIHSKEVSTKGGKLSCTECGKTFKNRTFLRRHASVHSSARPFKCDTCGKAFKRFDTLQEHQRGKAHALSLGPKSRPYTGGKITYSCKRCDQIFKHKVTLFRHESKSHVEDRPFGCDKCWKRYRNAEKLANHQKSAHDNKKTKERIIYSCALCEKTYTYLYSYKAHVMTHEIDKPFLCSQCGKSFRQKQGFLRHVSTMHKSENRHTCEVCGKSFKRKDHLTQHLRGKTHGRPAKEGTALESSATIKSESSSNRIVDLSSIIHLDGSRITNQSSIDNQSKVVVTGTNSSSAISTAINFGSRNAIVVETSPSSNPSCSNNYIHQGIVYRPEVIMQPSVVKHETHKPVPIPANLLNCDNHQIQNQHPNFTFTASNLFFDF